MSVTVFQANDLAPKTYVDAADVLVTDRGHLQVRDSFGRTVAGHQDWRGYEITRPAPSWPAGAPMPEGEWDRVGLVIRAEDTNALFVCMDTGPWIGITREAGVARSLDSLGRYTVVGAIPGTPGAAALTMTLLSTEGEEGTTQAAQTGILGDHFDTEEEEVEEDSRETIDNNPDFDFS